MSDDLSAVDVAATVVTVRVDTEEGMLERARRVVLPASLLLNCKHSLFFQMMDLLRLGLWDRFWGH